MERKKWTPKAEITDELLRFREKRKWQVTLRRYVLEKNLSPSYAIYFGLSIKEFRKWIELQFTGELSWQNFGTSWQFDHIVPVAYFDFTIEHDLLLCWNFINIRVENIKSAKMPGNKIEVIAAKSYFESLLSKTGYSLCIKMIDKINEIERSNIISERKIEEYIIKNKESLEIISTLDKEEFNSLNTGTSLGDILLEREILKKFG
jgi:hypothetical protein